jgi:soluble lytic murein transglycosylase-like protein
MQLLPETAIRFGVRDAFDPIDNIRGGLAYLRWLLSYFRGDVLLAAAAYNAGERTVERFGGVPPYPETMEYVRKIMKYFPRREHAFLPTITERERVDAWGTTRSHSRRVPSLLSAGG